MLILGDQRVGKTSLYRQLVRKNFKKDLKPTEGIDNNTVDTVDRRSWDIEREVWQEMGGSDAGERFGEAVINKVVPKLPKKPSATAPEEELVEEGELLKQVKEIDAELRKSKERANATAVHTVTPTVTLPPKPPSPLTIPVADHSHPQPPAPKIRRVETQRPGPSPPAAEEVRRPPAVEPQATPQRAERPTPKQKPDPIPRGLELPIPPPVESSVGRSESAGALNRRQVSKMNDIVKGKQLFEKKEPSLVLNALDFAGQKEYRPMHHCFIARRAIYIVVFKIPDLLDDLTKYDSIEEVRYWIHSIHAHIYPPDKTTKGADEEINRVFLVGTHRDEWKEKFSEEHSERINNFIREKLIRDKRCVNHICPIDETGFFFPVENSIDWEKRNDCYLHESGIKLLQDRIKDMSKDPEKLFFLHEHHPIKWLQFEEELKYFRNISKQPLVKVEEVEKIAAKFKISKESKEGKKKSELDLALQFFHDTGKIIYMSKLYIANLYS